MSLSQQLWAANSELAASALGGRFVRGVADGTLPREVFAGYIAQDAHFLRSFARAYALCLAASPDEPTLLAFADLITGVREELGLHAAYAARWGVDPHGIPPAPATLAYTDFLLATAATAGLGVTCAAMTPCMRLYAHLGQELAAVRAPAGPYAEWVRTYADPAFAALAARLEGLLDHNGQHGPQVSSAYRRAMQLEVGFFEAAFAGAAEVRAGDD
ncbi:MAG: TenA family protein [Frankiales bacterium]|nr:TenA family protein [Frankiales bacterium]